MGDVLSLCDKFAILMPILLDLNSVDDLKEIEKVAIENNITAYDASYVMASIRISSPLVVADNKLLEKTKDKYQVVHLENI